MPEFLAMEINFFFSISITLLETFSLTPKLAKKLSFESRSLLLEFISQD